MSSLLLSTRHKLLRSKHKPTRLSQVNISSEPVYVNTKAKFYTDHNFPNATRLYSEAIDLDPTDKTYWCNRAVARMKLEEYGYAVNDASEHPCNHH